ncbi:MAG: bifunctional phosphoglucose/phosphomannose isomerase [Candidatus Woesearchaeota archaeon]|jgi:glucose/mannose-6-phosphate isomerase
MGFFDKIKEAITPKPETPEFTDVHEIILNTAAQFEQGLKIAGQTMIPNAAELQHITFVAMGGSMHPGFLLKTYLENMQCKKQINIVRDYTIPPYISKKGFLIVVSYSGNTAETLEAYKQAYREGYQMLVITSGEKLKEAAEKNGTPLILIPKGYQPRHSMYILFGTILQIMQNSGILEKHEELFQEAIRILKKPIFEAMGKQIAEKIGKKITIIYTTPKLGTIAERWKISINENAKMHSFYNILPEMDHNEINAYATKIQEIHAIFIADEEETRLHRQRISATKQIIKEFNYTTTEIVIKGPSYLSRMLSAIHIGDWTSYYCAQQMGVDPLKVEVVEKLKVILKGE